MERLGKQGGRRLPSAIRSIILDGAADTNTSGPAVPRRFWLQSWYHLPQCLAPLPPQESPPCVPSRSSPPPCSSPVSPLHRRRRRRRPRKRPPSCRPAKERTRPS